MHILVTGAAGFIGFHVSQLLLARGDTVVGLDNLNDYYEVSLKEARLATLQAIPGFRFLRANLEDRPALEALFAEQRFDGVINLAAQAGVRYSLENPHAYIDSNIVGFMNILECCRHHDTGHLVYASSSSVYGMNTKMPFSVHDDVDHPVSLYAASKKANELMAHTYSHLYGLPTTGLRFFTVYGPWGRPDMALFLFTRAILADEPIKVFNEGRMQRDFTYIDDIAEGVVRVLDQPAAPNPDFDSAVPDPGSSSAPYRIYNIGNNQPVLLLDYIAAIEQALGMQAEKQLLPMQPGDVPATYADIDALEAAVGYRPATPVDVGVAKFIDWYRDYYQV
ncbi:NAD-dependent epimerase [Mangrovimicrobium sediminis]|uniref:NAD-dependent epimerase n=1 Tax=Mangrovimicrobium sediminis TaxID=2562682 RepID=A0A4Z0M0V9_9GAMM|nr:NAD-dependent epimerase [Haliea sp. SAOS-164]TGD73120.1 NAD-dependent epimerase [Haliea sp. SAOS-164]